MKGLFQEATLLRTKQYSQASRCGACGLYKHCRNPKMEPQGSGSSRIMIVLPPIEKEADKAGKFMTSVIGMDVKRLLQKAGLSVAADCYVTAATICHTKNPTGDQVDHCSFKLRESVRQLEPNLIIAIGAEATRNVVQFSWNKPAENTDRFFGYQIPSQRINTWVCPVIEPTYDDRDCSMLLFERQFMDALPRAKKKPWKVIPDYTSEVQILSAAEAVKFIKYILKKKGVIAWDLETNCLKPEHEASRILTGSICWQDRATVAFPWHQDVPAYMERLLVCPEVWKIASNLQFEHRWIRWHMKRSVSGWLWDTMQAAHALDNRKKVSSIKFQSFVRLGLPEYDDKIGMFFEAEDDRSGGDTHAINRAIQEIPLDKLLIYNGVDSLAEYRVAKLQAQEIGHPAGDLM